MTTNFDSVRIFKEDVETGFWGFQTHNRIEFVVDKRKTKQLSAKLFGNFYNVGTSRYHDDLMVYRPQDIRDFLAFLQKLTVKDGKVQIYKMAIGTQQILPNRKSTFYEPIEVDVNYLISIALECFVDNNISGDEQQEIRARFIKRCKEILTGLGVEKFGQQENEMDRA